MITQNYLKEIFDYKEGNLIWKVKTGKKVVVGNIAGSRAKDNYHYVRINKKTYMYHRLIYIWHYGEISKDMLIDHINMIKYDNRIDNLRLVTKQENHFNLDVNGYTYHKKKNKYIAQIQVNKKVKHLGYFDNPTDARNAYLEAKEKLHIIGDNK